MSTITNLDPEPWTIPHETRIVTRHRDYVPGMRYDPRPEFDVRDNPILADFADYWAHSPGVDATRVGVWLDASPELNGWPNATPEQIEHARHVLGLIQSESPESE